MPRKTQDGIDATCTEKDYSVHLYYVCQILVFNLINTIVTDMEGIIRIDRLPLGLGTDQWK